MSVQEKGRTVFTVRPFVFVLKQARSL